MKQLESFRRLTCLHLYVMVYLMKSTQSFRPQGRSSEKGTKDILVMKSEK